MAVNKQVLDLRHNSQGITQSESNEQQRNWTKSFLDLKAKDSLANYDPSRVNLNFEITKGGIIQAIDKSKSIAQKFSENLQMRGIKDPNGRKDIKRRQNTIAQFIFGGSRDKMLELAFGNQEINFEKGADNSHLHREKSIEDWAKDIYNFTAKKFGEDNIVSFYVHLDETNPHVHCSVIPFDEEKQCISWKKVFGTNRSEGAAFLSQLHDEIVEEVNSKYGMERGSSKSETMAKHRSTEEYKRDLVREVALLEDTVEGLNKQIQTMERKVKSFTTMLENLETQKENVQNEMNLLKEKFGDGEMDDTEFAKKIDSLSKKLDNLDEKIGVRQQQLDDTNYLLEKAKEKLGSLESENEVLQTKNDELASKNLTLIKRNENLGKVVTDKNDLLATKAERNAAMAYNHSLATAFEPLKESLTPAQWEILESSGASDLMKNPQQIMNCAMMLALGYLKQATAYAETNGGSAGPGSGWGRDKDEDDEHWWRRCIHQASNMMRSSGRKVGRKK